MKKIASIAFVSFALPALLCAAPVREIVLAGDAVVRGWEKAGAVQADELRAHAKVRLVGEAGETISSLRSRLEAGAFDGEDRGCVMLLVGAADLAVPTAKVSEVVSELRDLVTKIRERRPEVRILVSTLFPPPATAESGFVRRVGEYNAAIASLKDRKAGVYTTDFMRAFAGPDGTALDFLLDEAGNPKAICYRPWCDVIGNFIGTKGD